jgi:hypothetical protein
VTLSKQNKKQDWKGSQRYHPFKIPVRGLDTGSYLHIGDTNPREALEEEQEQTSEVETNDIEARPFRGEICAPKTAVLLCVGEKGQSPIPFTSLVIR